MLKISGVTITFVQTRPHLLLTFDRGLEGCGDLTHPHYQMSCPMGTQPFDRLRATQRRGFSTLVSIEGSNVV